MKKIVIALALSLALLSCTTVPASVERIEMPISKGSTVVLVQRPEMRKGAKCPMVIICHGLTGHKEETHLSVLADSLQAYGVASVRFDFNGHGESSTSFTQHSLANELDDLQVIYEYVNTIPWVDKSRIALTGHSQGGAVSGMKAGQLGADKIKCLSLMAPAACIHTNAMSNTLLGMPIGDIENLPDSLPFWGGRFIGKEYLKAARDLDIHAITAQYTGPTFILQGDADSHEIYVDAVKYKEFMPQAELCILPGYDHGYSQDIPTALVPAIHFLVDHLK